MPSVPQNLMSSNVQILSDTVLVYLQWEHSFDFHFTSTFPDRENYIITTDPPTTMRTIPITNTIIDLQNDIKYNVSVGAVNCAGESPAAKLQLGPYVTSGIINTQA